MSWRIYCDESRQAEDPYMILGGLALREEDWPVIEALLRAWHKTQQTPGELKWTKVRSRNLPKYLGLVRLTVELIEAGLIRFRAGVFETARVPYNHFSGSEREMGFYRLMERFLRSEFVPDAQQCAVQLDVYMDRRSSAYPLLELRRRLNATTHAEASPIVPIVRTLEAVDSAEHDLVQMVDVLVGAIGSHCNRTHLSPGASLAKAELVHQIAAIVRTPSLQVPMQALDGGFQIVVLA
ncbi:MAG: DUF3800 domain-containing protein [bacterium]